MKWFSWLLLAAGLAAPWLFITTSGVLNSRGTHHLVVVIAVCWVAGLVSLGLVAYRATLKQLATPPQPVPAGLRLVRGLFAVGFVIAMNLLMSWLMATETRRILFFGITSFCMSLLIPVSLAKIKAERA